MKTYLSALQEVLDNGTVIPNRTGTDAITVFGMQHRYDLSKGFPAVTTKKLAWKSMLSELLWMIEGSDDERRLCEILHGTRDPSKTTIWTANAQADYWKPKARFDGDLGRVYGVQWRSWGVGNRMVIDQISCMIHAIKLDPHGRRHLITAWNPGELNQMALPPCHMFAQFHVANNKLSCQMYQRSADMVLGVPYNIASYSILTHILAQVCGLGVGEFIHTIGNAHIYVNHVDAVKEQLSRAPMVLPTLWLNPEINDIDNFKMDDIKLVGYQSHPAIKAEMAV